MRNAPVPASMFLALTLSLGGQLPAGEAARVPDPDPARWDSEISAFARTGLPDRPVVFAGSSSFRLWKTLAEDLPDLPVVNRGFGGSHLSDLNAWLTELLVPLQPSVVLVYEGDNDLASGKGTRQFLADVRSFRDLMNRHLPGVPVGFLAIKPSPSREHLLPVQTEANTRLKAFCDTEPNFTYIDVATPLLDPSGRPDPMYFGRDRLHMNANGYHRWARVIGAWLRSPDVARARKVNAAAAAPRP